MTSLLLDFTDWDLTTDGNNDLALTLNERDERAQNVAIACRVWQGEAYFDTNFGVPYNEILAHRPPQSLVMTLIGNTAATVEGVESVRVELDNYDNPERILTGNIVVNGEENVQL